MKLERFSQECEEVIGFASLRHTIGIKKLAPRFRRIRPKNQNQFATLRTNFPALALRQLHVFTMSFDWFAGSRASFGTS